MDVEQFKKDTEAILKKYTEGGKMIVSPDYFPHRTLCCERVYETTGSCHQGECPYHCGGRTEGECEICEAVRDIFKEVFK
jgi:hypothetical protein